MTDTKPTLRVVSTQTVEGDQYTFSVQELSINSGPCHSQQDARHAVIDEILTWVQSLIPEAADLMEKPPLPTQYQKLEFIREIRPGAGASVLQRLVKKYGQKNNQELAEIIGLAGENKVSAATFSNALAGRGSRLVRCAIAMALKEQPSALWPSLSLKVRIADDETYISAMHEDAARSCRELERKRSNQA